MKTRNRNVLKNIIISATLLELCLITGTVMHASSYTIRDYSTWKVVSRSFSHSKSERYLKLLNNLEPNKYVLIDEWSGNAYIPWL